MINNNNFNQHIQKSKFVAEIKNKYDDVLCIGCSKEWFEKFYIYSDKCKIEAVWKFENEIINIAKQYDFIYLYDPTQLPYCKGIYTIIKPNGEFAVGKEYCSVDVFENLNDDLEITGINDVQHSIGKVIEEDGVRKVLSSMNEVGYSLFGPYICLPKGKYIAKYNIKLLSEIFPLNNENACILSICINGMKVINQKVIKLTDLLLEDNFYLTFDIDEISQVEFRVYSVGNCNFTVDTNRMLKRLDNTVIDESYKIAENENENISFSQTGEDVIVKWLLFDYLKLQNIKYLDIGAHHPSSCSNTYLFYKFKNCTGVCIEADPTLFAYFKQKRKDDIILNIGITSHNEESLNFYILDEKGLNTFSRDEAIKNVNELGKKIEQVIKVPTRSINSILSEYFPDGVEFVSLDIEGLEMSVLKSLDFEKHRPQVFCIETINNGINGFQKENIIIDYMISKNYRVFADTFINTIFVDGLIFNK